MKAKSVIIYGFQINKKEITKNLYETPVLDNHLWFHEKDTEIFLGLELFRGDEENFTIFDLPDQSDIYDLVEELDEICVNNNIKWRAPNFILITWSED